MECTLRRQDHPLVATLHHDRLMSRGMARRCDEADAIDQLAVTVDDTQPLG